MVILENQIINYIGLGARADFTYYRGTKASFQIMVANKDFDINKTAKITLYNQKHGTVVKAWTGTIPAMEYILFEIAKADLEAEKPLNYFIDCVYEDELVFYGNFEML